MPWQLLLDTSIGPPPNRMFQRALPAWFANNLKLVDPQVAQRLSLPIRRRPRCPEAPRHLPDRNFVASAVERHHRAGPQPTGPGTHSRSHRCIDPARDAGGASTLPHAGLRRGGAAAARRLIRPGCRRHHHPPSTIPTITRARYVEAIGSAFSLSFPSNPFRPYQDHGNTRFG